ncbi:MAG: A/G-specific adenine glycosylase [Myxococcota bacterium]
MATGLSDELRRTMPDRLMRWYARTRRDLPWRRTRDPYRIWLSETMLQQTRVETAIPYYERFLERFPSLEHLAVADEEDVLREWSGLGYYARARNLRHAARQVLREHGGELPRDAAALRRLPGVGAYTAGAIRSIAFREPAAIVDGNIERVLSRLLARRRIPGARIWRLAAELVPTHRPDLYNQALMELGARLCSPRRPACDRCPLRSSCRAYAAGCPERYPAPRRRTAPLAVHALAGVLVQRARVLLLRRPSRGLLGGLWELPCCEVRRTAVLVEGLQERTGLVTRVGPRLGTVRHAFSHRALELDVVRLERVSGRLWPGPDARWCNARALADLPLSVLMHKALEQAAWEPARTRPAGRRAAETARP